MLVHFRTKSNIFSSEKLHLRDLFGKLICIDLNDVHSSNLNSQKDPKDEAFSMKNIEFRPIIY